MNDPIILIPARLRSVRLPGKPLALLAGRPMIVHVVDRATAADLGPVVVATEDAAIADAVQAAGYSAIMTGSHRSGTDRIAEALAHVDPARRHDVVINLQGDEPEIDRGAIGDVLRPLADANVSIGTLGTALRDGERNDPNAVKLWGHALASGHVEVSGFTRSEPAADADAPPWRHVGIYAFRRAALERLVRMPPSDNEVRERLEQLRALDAGLKFGAMLIKHAPRGIDTQSDLDAARERFVGAA